MTEDTGRIDLEQGRIIGYSWQVVRKLGEGGCGSVYLVKNLENETEAAMKAESNTAAGGCVLKLEVAILKKLTGKQHVAQFLLAARLHEFSYVIMTLLGESLYKLVKKVGRQITVSTQVRIAGNTLFCLKQIHDIGFIHRDLKPANMALGYKTNSIECRFFHILDFGLARQYIVSHAEQPSKLMMRKPRERSFFRGTTRYCSIRMHDRAEQGRVDDLWSMIYLLAELRGPLPWANQNDKRVVGEMKRMHSDEVILQNSPMEFLEIAKHLRSLTYFNRPDYQKLFMLLISIMQKGKFAWNDPFDWELPLIQKNPTSVAMSPARKSKNSISRQPSRELDHTPRNMSKEEASRGSPSKERASKEIISKERSSMEKSSMEKLSREKMSKEKMSREIAPTENMSASAERAEDEVRKEYQRLLPFDIDFFASDPIGF
uniref:Protein kinase domain-containing protein n=1 Tax=Caenorhabditis japonica TaxID=281687 RepID=A0A8R1DQP0_CAEJA